MDRMSRCQVATHRRPPLIPRRPRCRCWASRRWQWCRSRRPGSWRNRCCSRETVQCPACAGSSRRASACSRTSSAGSGRTSHPSLHVRCTTCCALSSMSFALHTWRLRRKAEGSAYGCSWRWRRRRGCQSNRASSCCTTRRSSWRRYRWHSRTCTKDSAFDMLAPFLLTIASIWPVCRAPRQTVGRNGRAFRNGRPDQRLGARC